MDSKRDPQTGRFRSTGIDLGCSIDGCEQPHAGRGWCSMHWQRWKKHGDPLWRRPKRFCSMEGCGLTCVGNGLCKVHFQRDWRSKNLDYDREWENKHRDQINASRRRFYHANPEKVRAKRKRYQRTGEKLAAYNERRRQRRAEHREAAIERDRIYRQRNREKRAEYAHRRRLREFGGSGKDFTAEEWDGLRARYGNRCLCCGSSNNITADHVIPLSKGGANDIGNIQPLCGSCNSRKNASIKDYRPLFKATESRADG